MAGVSTVTFFGESGARYAYNAYALDNPKLPDAQGNYCFVRKEPGGFVPLYFGEADNLEERLRGHDKWETVKRHGVTHVCVRADRAPARSRQREEIDLIRRFRPIGND